MVALFFLSLRDYLNKVKRLFCMLVDDEDLDEDEEDDADGRDRYVDHSSGACHLAAGDDSDSDIDMDDVSTVKVTDLCM